MPPIVFPEQPPNRLPFGPLIPVGPVLPLGTLNGGPLVPPHTHRATTTTPIPSTTTMLLPRSGTPAAATAGGLRSAETYEQVGCGWDLLSQSCKDVFTVSSVAGY